MSLIVIGITYAAGLVSPSIIMAAWTKIKSMFATAEADVKADVAAVETQITSVVSPTDKK